MSKYEARIRFECTACGERCTLNADYIDDSEAECPEVPGGCPWGGAGASWTVKKGANDDS